MPRKYSHIQEHEKEIIELRSQGMTLRQIGEKLGLPPASGAAQGSDALERLHAQLF